jgi:translation initiation factor RLI1
MMGQAGHLKPDTEEGTEIEIPEFNVSYKPQKISPKFQGSVRQLLHKKIRDSYTHPQFTSDVMKPLQIEQLIDNDVMTLSGGELQRVALCLCLGKVFFVLRKVSLLAFIDLVDIMIFTRWRTPKSGHYYLLL